MSKENQAGEYSIYKIYWDDNDDVYVGHSMDMENRKKRHKNTFLSQPSPTRLLHQAFERNGLDNRKYEILETKWCNSKKEACELEKAWSKKLESNLNMRSPILTEDEKTTARRRRERTDEAKETRKKYYSANKEYILMRNEEYYRENEPKIKQQRQTYREERRQQINSYAKTYRETHKEIIREKKLKDYYDNQEEHQRKARERWHQNKDEINRRRRERAKQKREQTASLPSSENP